MLGWVNEEVVGFGFRASFCTYAHATLNSLLITELTIERIGDSTNDIFLDIDSLKGEENTVDFDWQPTQQLDMDTM